MTERTSLIEFPCEFPLKIMGARHDDFAQVIVAIVQRHAPTFDAASVQMRPSRAGNFISLTCVINAQSQEQVDALYRELSAHPWVKYLL